MVKFGFEIYLFKMVVNFMVVRIYLFAGCKDKQLNGVIVRQTPVNVQLGYFEECKVT